MAERKVPIEVSAHHAHLAAEHLAVLFGPTATLHAKRAISQPGQFAAEECVDVVTPKGKLTVRVVGPVRAQTQVELTASDCRALGLPVILRVSGILEETPGVTLDGPYGTFQLRRGVIVAQRHLHLSPRAAAAWNLKHGDMVSVRTGGSRPITFHQVVVCSRAGVDELSFMIDTDEANAAGLKGGEAAEVLT